MKKNKKAAIHIEMIISFALFFIFLIFLFTLLTPLKQAGLSDVLLDTMENGLKNAEITLIEIPLYVETITGCFKAKCPIEDADENHMFIKDKSGKEVNFNLIGNGQFINMENTDNFYYLYFLDENVGPPDGGLDDCPAVPDDHKFSTPRLSKLYSFKELEEIKTKYEKSEDTYIALKRELNFPVNSDFLINITTLDRQEIIYIGKNIPERVVVRAREIPLRLFKDKDTIRAVMIVKVW